MILVSELIWNTRSPTFTVLAVLSIASILPRNGVARWLFSPAGASFFSFSGFSAGSSFLVSWSRPAIGESAMATAVIPSSAVFRIVLFIRFAWLIGFLGTTRAEVTELTHDASAF